MRRFFFVFLSVVWLSTGIAQASMFQESTENLSGTVTKITRVAEEFKNGEAGMSGSLGNDRVVPAHFVIRIFDEVSGREKELILFQDQKDPLKTKQLEGLKAGMKVEISGYDLRGDEGSYFEAYFDDIKVNRQPE
jgi:hypothetical protein